MATQLYKLASDIWSTTGSRPTLSAKSIADNGDGTFTLTTVTDNGDGTWTANETGATVDGNGVFTVTRPF